MEFEEIKPVKIRTAKYIDNVLFNKKIKNYTRS